MATGEVAPQINQLPEMSRRDFLRRVAIAGGAIAMAPTLAACGEIGGEESWQQWPIGDLEPEAESEKKMFDVLGKYEDIKQRSGASNLEAALLTQAVLAGQAPEGVANAFNEFKNNNAADGSEAALLSVSATLPESSREEVASAFEQARNSSSIKPEEAANAATIASFTNSEVDTVSYYYERLEGQEKPVVPIVVMSRLLHESDESTIADLQEIEAAGIDNEYDKAAALFARTFTNASMEDITTIQKEIAGIEEIDAHVRADLIVAAIYNNLDLESTLEAYNFAGTLEGVSKEAAAKLAIALFASSIPMLASKEELRTRPAHQPRTGVAPLIFVPRIGGFYSAGSFGYGARGNTTFAPTSRGSSFSTPGKATARGGGRGGIGGGRGGSGTG